MLPDGVIATGLIVKPFLAPKRWRRQKPREDWELGGIALNDPSSGMTYQLWKASMVGDDVIVTDAANNATAIFNMPGILRLTLAFDYNMKPVIAYETLAGGFLYFFDTFVSANVHKPIPDGFNLKVSLDERRFELSQNSDVLLAYQKGIGLYYRQQRDRFLTEYELRPDLEGAILNAIGMSNDQMRMQFEFRDAQPPHPIAPVGTYADRWRIYTAGVGPALSEVEFLKSGAGQTTGGTAIASSYYNGLYVPANAFDKNTSTNYGAATGGKEWVGYIFAQPVTVDSIQIRARSDAAGTPMANIAVEYSADAGVTWKTYWEILTAQAWATSELRTFAKPVGGPVSDYFNDNTIADYTQYADTPTTWSVVGGQMVTTATGLQSILTKNGVSFADGEVRCTLTDGPDSGIVLRFADNGNYYLAAIYDGSSTINNKVRLYKRVGGTYTQLGADAGIAFPRGSVRTLSFSAVGTLLTVKFDGLTLITVNDSSHAGPGLCGMRHATNAASSKFSSFSWPTP